MDEFEKVEKLRERADVTYEEAKEALEKSGGDILDAMIYLEKNGKARAPQQESYSTYTQTPKTVIPDGKEKEKKEGFGDMMRKFGAWCIKWLNKGNRNQFSVRKDGEEVFAVPITLLVVLAVFAFWVVIPMLILGLFFNFRYQFEGPDMHEVDINKAMDNAADAAENLKNEFNNKDDE